MRFVTLLNVQLTCLFSYPYDDQTNCILPQFVVYCEKKNCVQQNRTCWPGLWRAIMLNKKNWHAPTLLTLYKPRNCLCRLKHKTNIECVLSVWQRSFCMLKTEGSLIVNEFWVRRNPTSSSSNCLPQLVNGLTNQLKHVALQLHALLPPLTPLAQ